MFCQECGKPIATGIRYCANCGTHVSAQMTASQQQPSPPSPAASPDDSQVSQTGNMFRHKWVWVVGVLIVIGAISGEENRGGLLILVSIVTGLVSFIGLIRPLPGLGLPTRKQAGIVWAASFVLFVIGGSLLTPDLKPKQSAVRETREQEQQETAEQMETGTGESPVDVRTEPEFVFTVEEFIERYHESTKNLDFEARISVKRELDNGEFITINLEDKINKNTGMILNANRQTRAVRSLTFIGAGDGELDSGMAIFSGIIVSIMAIENPSMPASRRGKRIKEVGFLELLDEEDITSERCDVKYILRNSEMLGVWLTASPVKHQAPDTVCLDALGP